MLPSLKRVLAIALVAAVSAIVGGVAVSALVVFISSNATGLRDLSYSVVMFSYTLPMATLLCGVVGATMASPLRNKLTNSRLKLGAILLTAVLVPTINTWATLRNPQFFINAIRWTDNQDPDTRAIYIKRLIALGPSAIEPVIAQVRNNGTRSRGTWQFNKALQGLGKAAHQQMLRVVDTETDPWKKIHLIDSLQEAFGDFSRVHQYLTALQRHGGDFYASALRRQLVYKYEEEIPDIFKDGDSRRFSPQFVKWYQGKSVPTGDLPRWQP